MTVVMAAVVSDWCSESCAVGSRKHEGIEASSSTCSGPGVKRVTIENRQAMLALALGPRPSAQCLEPGCGRSLVGGLVAVRVCGGGRTVTYRVGRR